MLSGIRLVIYDLDGTLIDSTEAIVDTFNIVLAEEGVPQPDPGIIESLIGEPMPEILKRLLPPERSSEVQRFWDAYIPVYARISPEKTRILPGVVETLRTFRARSLLQSIATQKKSAVARRVLGELGLLGDLDLVCGIDDVAHPKPAPDIVELTLRRLGMKPSEAVMVDDTTIGLSSGKNAGVHTVGVTTGTHSREKLLTIDPDYVIDELTELPFLIAP
jgi:HAD superfamily hydrolase (TIGR01509 family)